MASVYRTVAEGIRKSPFAVLLFFVFSCLTIACGFINYEDYMTTYLGYKAFPTVKATPWIAHAVAFVITFGDIALGVSFLMDTRASWKAFAALGFLVTDATFDIYFKTSGFTMGAGFTMLAIAETIIIYTLLSEMMFTLVAGITLELLPDAIREIGVWAGKIGKGIAKAVESLTGHADEDTEPQPINTGARR